MRQQTSAAAARGARGRVRACAAAALRAQAPPCARAPFRQGARRTLSVTGWQNALEAPLRVPALLTIKSPRRVLPAVEPIRQFTRAAAARDSRRRFPRHFPHNIILSVNRPPAPPPGVCYRLWDPSDDLEESTPPEIADADLAPLALELAAWGDPAGASLPWLDAPDPDGMESARKLLRDLGAVEAGGSGAATAGGRQMAALGLHPRFAHLVLRWAGRAPRGRGAAVAPFSCRPDECSRRREREQNLFANRPRRAAAPGALACAARGPPVAAPAGVPPTAAPPCSGFSCFVTPCRSRDLGCPELGCVVASLLSERDVLRGGPSGGPLSADILLRLSALAGKGASCCARLRASRGAA